MKKLWNNQLKSINLLIMIVVLTSGCEYLRIDTNGTPAPVVEPSLEKMAKAENLQPIVPASYTTDTESLLTLMRYSRYISDLSSEELDEEIKKTELVIGMEPTTRGQLKLAVLLSLPNSSVQSVERATELLGDVVNAADDSPPALREYAHLLLSSLQLRVETQKQNKILTSKLKQERSKRIQLEQKLEALKTIEKSINKRQNGTEEPAQ